MKILIGILLIISSGVMAYIFRNEVSPFSIWVSVYSGLSFASGVAIFTGEYFK